MIANELRIGNIVTVDNPEYHPSLKGIPLRVTGAQERSISGKTEYSVNLEHINQDPNTYYDTYSQFDQFVSPIPLTEEVLLRCGFEFKDNAYFSPAFNIGERIRIVGGNDNFHFIMNIHKSIKIKSLHQLQSLIFLVTEGKELEYGS